MIKDAAQSFSGKAIQIKSLLNIMLMSIDAKSVVLIYCNCL